MSDSRIKNSKRNLKSAIILQIINIILPFVVRTLILYKLGEEYQGLNGLFTSILQVLNLTDLGFSSAVVYILYKPIAIGDNDTVCALISYLKRVYRIIGIVILAIGLILLPFLKFLIKGSYPDEVNIYLLYLIYLSNSVISYWLFAYKTALLLAMQRADLTDKISSIIKSSMFIVQAVVLFVFGNYYVYVIFLPIFSIINNLLVQFVSKKYFPQITPHGKISENIKKEITKQVKGVFFNKLSNVCRNTIDTIVISSLVGLTSVAIYNNYFYIFTAIYGVSLTVSNCMQASVGNSIATEGVERNYKNLIKFTFIFSWFTSMCTICLCCLYQPFVKIWMSGNKNLMLTDFNMFLFCTYFYVITSCNIRNLYVSGAGLFWELRLSYFMEAAGNIILSFVLGYYFGVTGVLLATIITIVLFNFLSRNRVLFKSYFQRTIKEYYIDHVLYLFVTIVNCILTYTICSLIHIEGMAGLIIKLLICLSIPNALNLLVYFKTKRFKEAFKFIKSVFIRKNKI